MLARSIWIVLLLVAVARAEGSASDEFHDVGPELRRSIDVAIAAGVRFITDEAANGEFPALISKRLSQGGRQMLVGYARTVQSCFAQLFLNRATKEPAVPIRPPVVSGR